MTYQEADKSVMILNRLVDWTEDSIRYDADQRHAEIIISHLGMTGTSKAVTTPGVNDTEERGYEEDLSSVEATEFRALTARANYLAQDRSEISCAVKELTRMLSKTREGYMNKFKRLGRYVIGRERCVVKISRQ